MPLNFRIRLISIKLNILFTEAGFAKKILVERLVCLNHQTKEMETSRLICKEGELFAVNKCRFYSV